MTIFLESETEKVLPFDAEEVAKRVIEETLQKEGCPYEVEVNIILTTNDEIQKTNKEFRGIDAPTDVLSFPAVDYRIPSDFSEVEAMPEQYINPENQKLILGDIMISLDKVYEQAEEFQHSVKREFAFLVVHSMLHLLGYDHVEEADREMMEEKQEYILFSLGIVRE